VLMQQVAQVGGRLAGGGDGQQHRHSLAEPAAAVAPISWRACGQGR
jgi:hypothetical protein